MILFNSFSINSSIRGSAMFRAALKSAFASYSQTTHLNFAWLERLASAMCPHVLHLCDVYFGATFLTLIPHSLALYSTNVCNSTYDAFLNDDSRPLIPDKPSICMAPQPSSSAVSTMYFEYLWLVVVRTLSPLCRSVSVGLIKVFRRGPRRPCPAYL